MRQTPGYISLVALCAGVVCRGDTSVPDPAAISRRLAAAGIQRQAGTCANDLSRMADTLNLGFPGRHVSRDQLARAAVAAGWVGVKDVSAAGLLP